MKICNIFYCSIYNFLYIQSLIYYLLFSLYKKVNTYEIDCSISLILFTNPSPQYQNFLPFDVPRKPCSHFTNLRTYLTTYPIPFNSRNTLRPSSFKRTQSPSVSNLHIPRISMKSFVTIFLIFHPFAKNQFPLTNS